MCIRDSIYTDCRASCTHGQITHLNWQYLCLVYKSKKWFQTTSNRTHASSVQQWIKKYRIHAPKQALSHFCRVLCIAKYEQPIRSAKLPVSKARAQEQKGIPHHFQQHTILKYINNQQKHKLACSQTITFVCVQAFSLYSVASQHTQTSKKAVFFSF